MIILALIMLVALVYMFRRVSKLDRDVRQLTDRLASLIENRGVESLPAEKASVTTEDDQSSVTADSPSLAQNNRADLVETPPVKTGASLEAESDMSSESRKSTVDPWISEQKLPSSAPKQPSFLQLSFFDSVLGRVKRYFTEGNVIVRVGVIVLFFGVAFLLQYANEKSMLTVPIQFKVFAVGLLGLVLLSVGWYLRHSRRLYALILQGGGIGILYITIFGALHLFQLLSAGVSFGLLVAVVVALAALAVLQNARSLAVMALTGGFLAPVLTSSGEGSHVVLFSYYAVLNGGILAISWFKAWRALNLIGFVFTFFIGTLWGVLRYTSDQLPSAQAFLGLFFVFYVFIALLYAKRQPPQLRGYVDATLVFGVPVVSFGLQAGLVYHYQYGLAWSALALGGFYAILTLLCRRFGSSSYHLLGEAYLALALVFASLSIPFAFDGEWVATAWALEGAAILWVSLRQGRYLGTLFALILQIAAGVLFLPTVFDRYADLAVLNAVFMGSVCIALAGLFSSYYLPRAATELFQVPTRYLASLLLVWGGFWWFGNGLIEIVFLFDFSVHWVASMGFIAVSALALGLLERQFCWHELRFTSLALGAVMALFAAVSLVTLTHPMAEYTSIGWPLLFTAFYALLWLRDQQALLPYLLLRTLHAGGWWLLTVLLTVEGVWAVDNLTPLVDGWLVITPALIVMAMYWLAQSIPMWPFTKHRQAYTLWVGLPLLSCLVIWTLFLSTASSGDFDPIIYLPLINFLDLTQIMVLMTIFVGWRMILAGTELPFTMRHGIFILMVLSFLWLNAVLLRTMHHWFGIVYHLDAMIASSFVQAAVSVFWTLTGLGVMLLATYRGWRSVWIVAAILLSIVVAKLFLVDMQDSNTLASIFAFIVVGLLLLVIGYFSPLPPQEKAPS